jgi:hypothetical protein
MSGWTWNRAAGTDVTDIMDLTREHFRCETSDIWVIDEQHFACSITLDIVKQFFNPGSAFVAVARDTHTKVLVGYVWAERGIKTVWSTEEMIAIKIVHVDMALSARQRVRMVKEMISIWELWAESIGVPIVCSSTMRGDQTGFLRLHQAAGYDCRGSICYRRLQIQSGTQGTDHSHQHADNADLH